MIGYDGVRVHPALLRSGTLVILWKFYALVILYACQYFGLALLNFVFWIRFMRKDEHFSVKIFFMGHEEKCGICIDMGGLKVFNFVWFFSELLMKTAVFLSCM